MSAAVIHGPAEMNVPESAPSWRAGTIFAIALHTALAAAIVYSQSGEAESPAAPSSAITVDLAPLASAPPQPATDLPEGPPIDEPEPADEAELEPEPPLPQPAAVTLPEPVARPQPRREMTAPPASALPAATKAAAPVNATPNAAERAAMMSYEAQILAHLKRHQQYPRAAKRRRLEGTARVTFRLDRQGKVLSRSIVGGSGYEILDQATLAAVDRASPMPPPPDGIPSDTVSVTVPVHFELSE